MESAARTARIAKGMSIEEAARALSIPAGYLSQIENGKRHVSDQRAENIACLYEVEVSKIFSASRYVICEQQKKGGEESDERYADYQH
ncbi:XRE family transcriptional regulator [Paenibacillus algicola]|uniref:XRE family transcriptional regulator n=1 Tax=Paenibacillus algicola TaxID=2565926 RepID=A0A4P8XQH8_9BACL|nr:XRE family transcriptional regulator [Paenibacillus algicola]